MLEDFKVICFDAGGTLFRPFPSVGEVYQEVSARYGCTADAATLEKLFYAAWLERDDKAASRGETLSEKAERQWWHNLVRQVFDEAGGVREFEDFFEELYNRFASPECWQLYPEVLEVLEALRARGKRLCIVSNWDSRLFGLCEGLQLNRFFDFILASAVFGSAKPGPRIFAEALRQSGAEAREAVHIGDSCEDDVFGARGAGLHAILIDRKNHQNAPRSIEGIPRVHDLRELL